MCRHAASHGNAMVQSKHHSSSSSCRTPAYNGCHAYSYFIMEVVLVCWRKPGLEHDDDDDVYLFICYCCCLSICAQSTSIICYAIALIFNWQLGIIHNNSNISNNSNSNM